MAYVLLAVGALMAVCGLYAAITGYRIVQVEEGWTSVIAGTTLFVGGLVTIGLALVLQMLAKLTKALQAPRPAPVAEVTDTPAADLPPELPAAVEPPVSVAPEPSIPPPLPSLPPLAPAPPPTKLDKVEPAVDAELRPPKQPRPPIPPLPRVRTPATPEPPAAPVPPLVEPEPVAETSHDAYQLETPSTGDHDLVPPPSGEGPDPRSDEDWLDKAFAEFDRELPRHAPPPLPPSGPAVVTAPPAAAPAPPPPVPDREPAAPILAREPETAETPSEPLPTPAPAPLSPPPNPSAAVIGRYESDGTSYVMYSDGSIEAQSANGVYRFASMAELKAFIEG